MVFAAAISAAPGGVLFSAIFMESFAVWVIGCRDSSAGWSADREAASAAGWANNTAAAVANTARLHASRRDRQAGARPCIAIFIRHPPS
jgi:hypothetical protein